MNDIVRRSIAVYDGQLVDPFTVTHRDGVFRLETIAHSMAQTNRYAGHTSDVNGDPVAYSVAEHCLLVERIIAERMRELELSCTYELMIRRKALVHDAAEAYLGDLVAPFKGEPDMWFYRAHETRLMHELLLWFGLDTNESPSIKAIDVEIRGTEARQLFRVVPPEWEAKLAPVIPGIQCGTMSPIEAKTAWLAKFWELFPDFKE
jgi:hypothetical protein